MIDPTLNAFISGVIQGATEFLPISSSGHLALYHSITKTSEEHLLFDVMLHLGTLVAVLAVYGGDLASMILSVLNGCSRRLKGEKWRVLWQRDADLRLAGWLIVATVPAAVAGALLEQAVEQLGNNSTLVGFFLIANGWILFAASRRRPRVERPLNLERTLGIGLAQALAILPGVSRSGTTISAAMASGQSPRNAARFSFLLSVPIILGAAAVKLLHAGHAGPAPWGQILLAAVVSAVVGYAALRLLLGLLRRGRFGVFAYYCWALGLAAVVIPRLVAH